MCFESTSMASAVEPILNVTMKTATAVYMMLPETEKNFVMDKIEMKMKENGIVPRKKIKLRELPSQHFQRLDSGEKVVAAESLMDGVAFVCHGPDGAQQLMWLEKTSDTLRKAEETFLLLLASQLRELPQKLNSAFNRLKQSRERGWDWAGHRVKLPVANPPERSLNRSFRINYYRPILQDNEIYYMLYAHFLRSNSDCKVHLKTKLEDVLQLEAIMGAAESVHQFRVVEVVDDFIPGNGLGDVNARMLWRQKKLSNIYKDRSPYPLVQDFFGWIHSLIDLLEDQNQVVEEVSCS
ncbi:unnamed protein product, partial [Cyprideis torosa]